MVRIRMMDGKFLHLRIHIPTCFVWITHSRTGKNLPSGFRPSFLYRERKCKSWRKDLAKPRIYVYLLPFIFTLYSLLHYLKIVNFVSLKNKTNHSHFSAPIPSAWQRKFTLLRMLSCNSKLPFERAVVLRRQDRRSKCFVYVNCNCCKRRNRTFFVGW